MSSDSVTLWWLRRGKLRGRSMLEQRLRVLFGDPKGSVEWARKGITLRIASKAVSSKCVSRA